MLFIDRPSDSIEPEKKLRFDDIWRFVCFGKVLPLSCFITYNCTQLLNFLKNILMFLYSTTQINSNHIKWDCPKLSTWFWNSIFWSLAISESRSFKPGFLRKPYIKFRPTRIICSWFSALPDLLCHKNCEKSRKDKFVMWKFYERNGHNPINNGQMVTIPQFYIFMHFCMKALKRIDLMITCFYTVNCKP